MNPGRTNDPSATDPDPTTRRLISDISVGLLADAYGIALDQSYDFVLPSTLDTAHATLDSETGTLLVQGLSGEVVDDIDVNLINNGDNIEVLVNGTREVVASIAVSKIVIAGNGGNDDIFVQPTITQPWQEVDYVVSSNADTVDTGTIGDGLVDSIRMCLATR